ncbi:MAG: hypothetical protein ISS25_02380 [Nanoarchaeota archaeon]|nr:hypothetical protein [Nanoarchaeota archaeon]
MDVKKIFSLFKNFLMKFSEFITSIINFIILVPVFFIGVGLTSLFSKIVGKHFLNLRIKEKESYWLDKNLTTQKLEKYYRMF